MYNQASIDSQKCRKEAAPRQKLQTQNMSNYSPQQSAYSISQNMPQSQTPSQTPQRSAQHQNRVFSQNDEYPGAFDVDYDFQVTHTESILLDFKNDPSPSMDLGADGAFSKFIVLIVDFHLTSGAEQTLIPALHKKGFKVTVAKTMPAFLDQLKQKFDIIIFISGHKSTGNDEEFKAAILKAHHEGVGIFMFSDNRPFFYHCNLVLPEMAGCTLIGNDQGNQKLVYGADPLEPGRFDMNHLLFSGINNMFEGVTISYPTNGHKFKVVASNTHGRPVICILESTKKTGRVVVDFGFTKLRTVYWQETGQARYIVNSCVWLVDLERRGEVEPAKVSK
jgi:hypothetical protein